MKKQTSVEWLALQLYEQMEIRGSGTLIQDILEQAKAMHKEEVELPIKELSYQKIMKAASDWIDQNGDKWSNNNNEVGDNYGSFIAGAQWYKEQLKNI